MVLDWISNDHTALGKMNRDCNTPPPPRNTPRNGKAVNRKGRGTQGSLLKSFSLAESVFFPVETGEERIQKHGGNNVPLKAPNTHHLRWSGEPPSFQGIGHFSVAQTQ